MRRAGTAPGAALLAATLGALACSSSTAGLADLPDQVGDAGGRATSPTVDDGPIVPPELHVEALAGGNGVLEVTTLTLREGSGRTELYAALRNVGEVPACSAALAVELFDHEGQSIAAGIGGLLARRFYRRTDGSGALAACVGPGEVTMAALTDLPAGITAREVALVLYHCPYFALDVVPIGGLRIEGVEAETDERGTSFTGTLVNGLDVAVRNPSVTVFPVSPVGRPLGAAIGRGMLEIPIGGSWYFVTDPIETSGVDQLAYPAGALGD